MVNIKENFKNIKKNIPEGVLLVTVTKTHTPLEINKAIEAGATDIGENKVQEILDKFDSVKPVRWHMIGHLQTNKVKYIIDKVDLIHSVDSIKLAKEIDKRAKEQDKVMDILIQVNTAGEESKFGISPDKTKDLIDEILDNCENVCIKGLMCIAPLSDDEEVIRTCFASAKKQYDEFSSITRKGMGFEYLSMGMSGDYQLAIEEGSNLVRVGSAIFGPRGY